MKYRDKAIELRSDLLDWLKMNKSAHYDGVKSRNLTGLDQSTGSVIQPMNQFRIFPNPTSGSVTIDSNNIKIEGINVYSLSGLNLFTDFESFTGQKTIDLPLSNGICLIKLDSKYQFQSQKIKVQN